MINQVVLIGRLTRDPELRRTNTGTAVANFTLAVNRDFAKDAEQEADFVNCVAWQKTAELVSQYVHKGDMVAIVGRIQTRSYQDNAGNNRTAVEVVVSTVQFMPKSTQPQAQSNQASTCAPASAQAAQTQSQYYGRQRANNSLYPDQVNSNNGFDIDDDDIQF